MTIIEYSKDSIYDCSELLAGREVQTPHHGARHGAIKANLATALREYSKKHKGVAAMSCGFVLMQSETVVGPDVAYVSAQQMRRHNLDSNWKTTLYWFEFAPSIAIEVEDFNEHQNLHEKAKLYLDHGTREVWIVEAESRTVEVRRAGQASHIYMQNETLQTDVLPDFQMPLAEVFED